MPLGGSTIELPAELIKKSAGFSIDIGKMKSKDSVAYMVWLLSPEYDIN